MVVHPDDDVWDSIAIACREAMARFPGDPADVVAAGLCTIRFCRALVDAQGRLVEPLLSWMDDRVSRPHTRGDPRVATVTTSSGYISGRLTGERIDTRGNYQGVWPIDQVTGEWSTDPESYLRTGMDRDLLVDLVSPGEVLGAVTPSAASETGLPVGIPVYATSNDKAVEALGCGLLSEDEVVLSLGTYIAATTVGTDPMADSPDHWVNFGGVPGQYLYESNGIRRGMWTVSWVRELVLGGAHADAPDGEAAPEALLDAEASGLAPGCNGLVAVLDWLAPVQAPHRRGVLLGFDGTQGRGHVHRAVLEGIAMTMAGHLEAMERRLARRFAGVTVAGGGSRSDLMMQILADVLARPVRRTENPDGAGLGAAVSAAVGHGLYAGWPDAVAAMVRPGQEFTPEESAVSAYVIHRRAYEELRRGLDLVLEGFAARRSSADRDES